MPYKRLFLILETVKKKRPRINLGLFFHVLLNFLCVSVIYEYKPLNNTHMNTTKISNALIGTPLFNENGDKVGHYIESTNTVVVENIPTAPTELYVYKFHETIGFWIYIPIVTIYPDATFIDHTLTIETED